NTNIKFLLKSKEQIKEEENRALESINETPAQKAAKRRRLNEEVEELKQHLEIVPDEDNDVYTEATPLARKMDKIKFGRVKEVFMWCTHHIIYNHSTDFASRKKIPTLEVYTRSNAECSETSSGRAE
nr:hypothetical protein [Tanacetum cinerariifolium]